MCDRQSASSTPAVAAAGRTHHGPPSDAVAHLPAARAIEPHAERRVAEGRRGDAHIDVLKADIEGSEYDLLPEVFALCRQGFLTRGSASCRGAHWPSIGQRQAQRSEPPCCVPRGPPLLHHCQLMLFHKELNTARAGRNSEFSWVSMRHMLRAQRQHASPV